jgi:hypothetical protein
MGIIYITVPFCYMAAGSQTPVTQSHLFAVLLVIAISTSCLAIAVSFIAVVRCCRLLRFPRCHRWFDEDSKRLRVTHMNLAVVGFADDKSDIVHQSAKMGSHQSTVNNCSLTFAGHRNDIKTNYEAATKPLLVTSDI